MTDAVVISGAAAALALDPTKEVCGNCFYCRGEKGGTQCRLNPPQLMYVPVPGPGLAGGPPPVHWVSNCAYPPVGAKTPACGQFRPKAALAN